MKKFFLSFIIILFLVVPAFAEFNGTINFSSGNSIVSGLWGKTAPTYCNTTSDCNGYFCYTDYDDSSDGGKGWCLPYGYTSCAHSSGTTPSWYADGTKVCYSSAIKTCDDGVWSSEYCEYGCLTNSSCKSSSSTTETGAGTGTGTSSQNPSITISRVPEDFNITQNQTATKIVEVKNNGQKNLTSISLKITGIDEIYSISPSSYSSLSIGESKNFTVSFSIPENFTIKAYTIKLNATTSNSSVYATASFIMRVLPSNVTVAAIIIPSISQYYFNFTNMKNDIINLQNQGVNVTELLSLLNSIEKKLNVTNASIQIGDYFTAYTLLSDINNMMTELNVKISNAKGQLPTPNWFYPAIIVVVIAVAIILAYLLIPKKERYTFPPKERKIDKIKKLFKKEKEFRYSYRK